MKVDVVPTAFTGSDMQSGIDKVGENLHLNIVCARPVHARVAVHGTRGWP
jgi:hypothetical protein